MNIGTIGVGRVCVLVAAILVASCGGGGGGGGSGGSGGGGGGTPSACGLPPNPNITLNVVASRTSGVAPLAVFFDASASSATTVARPFHDLEYRWDFDFTNVNPASGNWATGARGGTSPRKVASGPLAAHVYTVPGTYTVCVTATDGANAVAQAITITVTDPDTVFAGASTICISASGTFTEPPCDSGTTTNVTTSNFATAIASAGPGTRLLFRRGETWSAPAPGVLNVGTGPGLIGAFGSGARPKIQAAAGNNSILNVGSGSVTVTDWRIMDLELDGQDISTGCSPSCIGRAIRATGDMRQILFYRLHIHDSHNGIQASFSGSDDWDQVFIVDSTIENIGTSSAPGATGGVGVFWAGTRFAMLGNLVDDVTLSEHVTRFQFLSKAVISNNTLSRPASGKAALKLHGFTVTTGVFSGIFTEQVVISDNRLASGQPGHIVEVMPQTSSNDERLRDILIERNWFEVLSAAFNRPFIQMSGTDITFRNNLGDMTPGTGTLAVQVERRGAEPNPVRVNVYHNSFFSNDSGAVNIIEYCTTNAGVTQSEVKNNLAYAPNSSGQMVTLGGCAGGVTVSNNTVSLADVPPWVSLTPAAPNDFQLTGATGVAGAADTFVHSDFAFTLTDRRPETGDIDIGAFEF